MWREIHRNVVERTIEMWRWWWIENNRNVEVVVDREQ